jgi:hypothetical protein
LSLTLRDAQHLSWKTFKKFEALSKIRSARLGTEDDLVRKSNEIAEKLKAPEKSKTDKSEIEKLISELLFSAFVFSERNAINLEDAFLQTVDDLILSFVS